jgi:hypothetical protein
MASVLKVCQLANIRYCHFRKADCVAIQKTFNSACHAGLDPASSNIIR